MRRVNYIEDAEEEEEEESEEDEEQLVIRADKEVTKPFYMEGMMCGNFQGYHRDWISGLCFH